MRKRYFLLTFVLACLSLNAKTTVIYSKSYGLDTNPAIIFIHGGPRGNATLFEGTTARKLSEKGFFVVVYDRRGEGRSIDTTATFTFKESINDLNDIYLKYNLKKANIIAHSFGGIVGTLFAAEYPEKVISLILAGALISQQETYDHILKKTKKIYDEKKDNLMLSKIFETEKLAKNSADYRYQCYDIASKSNFFKMPFLTEEATQLREQYELSEFGKNNIRNDNASILFYKNESKNNIDIKPVLANLKKKNVKIFAIYGQQDQIFSQKQLKDLEKIVTKNNLKVIQNCSHYLFVDQQNEFLETVKKWII